MVEPVNLLIVKIIVVKLGVIMGLHEASACKVVDHGRDTGNGHGKIIGPGFNGGGDAGFLRISLGQIRQLD